VVITSIDESPRAGESGAALVERLARAKATAITESDGLHVLAADTTVVCDGRLLEKPASEREAREMLRLLSGRSHLVMTGVCVAHEGRFHSDVAVTAVGFAPITAAEIDWYVSTGEPMDKAGGYHIGGRGALFVTEISGSPSNVEGLPVHLVRRLLRKSGFEIGGTDRA